MRKWLCAMVFICCMLIMGSVVQTDAKASTLYTQVSDSGREDGYFIRKISSQEIQEVGCWRAVQDALDEAELSASATNPFKIIIEPGNYELNHALKIYSNTYLYAKGVIFTQTKDATANMIRIGAIEDNASGYYYQNITIDGGIWNENGNSNTAIKYAHGKNVSLMNATVKNCKNSHLMEVAGCDGLLIQNCKFEDQILSKNAPTNTYEAVQLDVLSGEHMEGYRSEDLPLRNIVVKDCTFDNVPRGVGSHTAILNNPVKNIIISGNHFTNLKSLAIQAMNYVDCRIEKNIIQNTPRGIAVFSVKESGTYLASTLAEEGKVPTKTANSYKTPNSNQQIVISGNLIHAAGKDPYEDYENTAIFVNGLNVKTPVKRDGDIVPKGNYYLSGVQITNNVVDTVGHGIRLQNVRNASVAGNNIVFDGDASKIYYGIQLREGVQSCNVQKNNVVSPVSGIHVYSNCLKITILENQMSNAKTNGIVIEKSSADKISRNKVMTAGLNGIMIYHEASAAFIDKNEIFNISGYGITIRSLTGNMEVKNNVITKSKKYLLYCNPSTLSYTVSISGNQLFGLSGVDGVRIDSGRVKFFGNKIQNCNRAVVINQNVKAVIKPNTLSNNKINRIRVKAAYVSNLKITGLKVTVKKGGKAELKWKKASGVYGYVVYRKTGSKGTYQKMVTLSGKSKNTYLDKKVKKGKVYYYKVIPYSTYNKNKITAYGSGSSSKAVKIK